MPRRILVRLGPLVPLDHVAERLRQYMPQSGFPSAPSELNGYSGSMAHNVE
jgi:hypothetical protein